MLDTILVFFSALVARDSRDLPELALKSDFITTLFSLLGALDKSNDFLWLLSCDLSDIELRQAGMAKLDKTLVCRLHSMPSDSYQCFSSSLGYTAWFSRSLVFLKKSMLCVAPG